METAAYHRREPEKTVLHRVVREHLLDFLEYAGSRLAAAAARIRSRQS